jgi:hypothetical protein
MAALYTIGGRAHGGPEARVAAGSNPMPIIDDHVDGASTGVLEVSKGDELYFLCDINNTLDTPLKFANEAIDGEMCILFGSYLGDTAPCSAGAKRVKDADTGDK